MQIKEAQLQVIRQINMPESTEPTLWDLQFVSKETGQVAGGVQEAQDRQTEDLKVWNFV